MVRSQGTVFRENSTKCAKACRSKVVIFCLNESTALFSYGISTPCFLMKQKTTDMVSQEARLLLYHYKLLTEKLPQFAQHIGKEPPMDLVQGTHKSAEECVRLLNLGVDHDEAQFNHTHVMDALSCICSLVNDLRLIAEHALTELVKLCTLLLGFATILPTVLRQFSWPELCIALGLKISAITRDSDTRFGRLPCLMEILGLVHFMSALPLTHQAIVSSPLILSMTQFLSGSDGVTQMWSAASVPVNSLRHRCLMSLKLVLTGPNKDILLCSNDTLSEIVKSSAYVLEGANISVRCSCVEVLEAITQTIDVDT